MRFICTLISCFFIIFSLSAQSTITGTLSHGGVLRDYRLRIPPNHKKDVPVPLVFNLHGYSSNAVQQELYSGMNAVADTAGFIVCYPNGVASAWNVGWAFGSTADDVGFIGALIDELHAKYGINKKRVYSCGMSNGGFMSYTLACSLNDRIAAIASVTGSMIPEGFTTCKPGKSVPVMEIHGTADGTVNYNGTPLISAPIPDVLKFWQVNNGCDETPVIVAVPNISLTDNTTSEKWTYTNCKDGSQLIHFKVIGGAHTWPGAILNIGATSQDFNASVEIWRFFRQFELSIPSSSIDENAEFSSVFPNPFDELIVIDSEPNAILSAYHISGKLMIQLNTNERNTILSTQSWPSGIYVLCIKNNERNESYKMIKY